MSRTSMDMTRGSLKKQILFFSIPLMLSNLLQVLFNMSDIAVIGQFAGAMSLGAVGSTTTLISMYTGFLIGLSGIHLMEAARKKKKLWLFLPVSALVVLAGVILGTICMVDYYGAGVLMVFIFYFFRGRKWWCLAGQLLTLYWVNVELLGGLMYPICLFGMDIELCQQGLALLALIPIWLYRGRQGYHSKAFQLSCYAFYPVHMLILVLILNYVNSF